MNDKNVLVRCWILGEKTGCIKYIDNKSKIFTLKDLTFSFFFIK